MGTYESDARELLRLVGGKDNIASLSHCVTRMRFTLVDPSLAKVPAIERLSSVKGTFECVGQIQVIIGKQVADFYDDFVATSGITGDYQEEEAKKPAAQKGSALKRLMASIAEAFGD